MSANCRKDGDFITLSGHPGLPKSYDVALNRCSTPESILGWVHHLSEKNWVSKKMLREFIEIAANHHGIEYRPIP